MLAVAAVWGAEWGGVSTYVLGWQTDMVGGRRESLSPNNRVEPKYSPIAAAIAS